jgi:hypothetical protein
VQLQRAADLGKAPSRRPEAGIRRRRQLRLGRGVPNRTVTTAAGYSQWPAVDARRPGIACCPRPHESTGSAS